MHLAPSTRRIAAALLALCCGLAALLGSGVVDAQSGVDGRIVVRPWADDDGNLTRVEFGFRPGWGEDVRGGGDGPDDIFPPKRFLTRALIDERAGIWLRSSEILILDAEGAETGVRGRIIARAETDDEGNLVRVGFGFRPAWGEDVRGEQSGPDDIFPTNRFLTRRLIDESADKWLRSSLITVPTERPAETIEPPEPAEGEVGPGGGYATTEDGATIIVPAGAAEVGVKITARALAQEEYADILPEGVSEVAGVWDFSTDGDLDATVMIKVPLPDAPTRPGFLGHYINGEWYAQPVQIEDGFAVAEVDSLSKFSWTWGIPVLGPVIAGCDLLGGKCGQKVERVIDQALDKLWEGVTWTVDWAAEVVGLKDPVVCNNPDPTVTVDNPSGGDLIDRIVGVYLKGCAQATLHDGPLLVARNPRHIWFDVRPIRGPALHAQGNEAYSWISSHEEGTLLGPGATADWRATQDGVVVLNADFSWTAAGVTLLYPVFTAMLSKIVPASVVGEAAATVIKELIDNADELHEALNQFRRGHGEAAFKTLADAFGGEVMKQAFINALVAVGRNIPSLAGVLTRTAVGAAFAKLDIALKIGGFVRSGAEALKVLVRNDEDRFGTVAFTVPRSVCWGDDLRGGATVSDRLGISCQSERRSERYARYYRFELEQAGTVTIDLTSSQLNGHLYLSAGEGRSGRVVASDADSGSGWNARIEQELEAGVYTIEATTGGFLPRLRGTFNLRVAVSAEPTNVFTAVSAGGYYSCGLRESGEVECWGGNYHGQADAPAGRFNAVSAGGEHGCGLRETGAVECWGDNDAGQANAPAGRFSAVSAGWGHSCGLRETGAVECWGNNEYGQANAPAGRFSAVSAGVLHSCGLRETGAVECWGNNEYGQANAPTGRFSAVSAGWGHSCGLRETGAVECWGENHAGQANAPAGRFSAVSAGWGHSCGLRETGAVECWGDNDDGQTNAPTGRFSAVSAGGEHSCGLRESGEVECWGGNYAGQADAPTGRFSAVSASGWHSCGLRETGAVECWGENHAGQANAPAGRFSAVSAGWGHSCGLRETGAVECWGNNEYGQANAPSGRFSAVSAGGWHSCGLRESGAMECWGSSTAPICTGPHEEACGPVHAGQADAPSGHFSAVSAGGWHSCGLRETGAVECWGSNHAGQADAPSGRFSAVSAGGGHSCGLRESGAVECWEDNDYSGLADAPAGRFSAVSAGDYHSCGLRESGEVECWGDDSYGKTDAPSGRFSAVSAGRYHSCGLRETGVVECWGNLATRIAP